MAQDLVLKEKKREQRKKEKTTYEKEKKYMLLEARLLRFTYKKKQLSNQEYLEERKATYTV